jgi:putative DNA primase/helicase
VPAWAKWLRWDGARWAADDRLGAFDLARAVCREAAAEAACDRDGAALARVLNSAATVAAVERMARGDQRHARPPAEFDSDPWALNTPGGVMDLRTGRLAPHDPAAMHTKIAGATPGGECPRWCNFLRQITQGDDELAGFLQRFAGYTLTGDISEQAFLVAYGPGGNGKGVLFSTLLAVMGDYARTASPQVFTVSRNEQHETNVAALRGARMVAVTETEEGRQWAEARVKAVTGGDTISARVMRGDPFDFRPCCKLWFSGNHRPPLRNPDAAMRRRMHLVPLTYVPAKPDTGLGEALRAELGGIMAWAADGCLAWQRMGLAPPAAVRSATDEYFAAQDVLGEWLAERVERVPRAVAQSADLYAAWSIWATRRGEEAGTQKRFSEAMERCAAKRRTAAGVVFEGVRLRAMVAFDGVNADADTPIQW